MNLGKIRAFQIDLARQIETLPTVFRFFDVAARSGFNMCVLYLEDRIKTASYPYSPDAESYSVDEVAEIVAYADKCGLELVPVVSNLGHTERFLRHQPLVHLAERRGAIAGRFSKAGDTNYNSVCPELPETAAFFDRYIAEVAALFPSKYFHVGLDEVFDMGYCELCKPIVDKGGLSELFYRHILRTHDLLTSLGKTMMMWDDMFEMTPGVLERIPKDIVMCSWFYDYIDRRPDGHFNNRARIDIAAYYERLGIPYLISTSWRVENIESFTRYAEGNYHPLGMFATSWEMSREQLLPLHFVMANAGLLWQGIDRDDPYARLVKAVELVLNRSDCAPALAAAMLLPRTTYRTSNLTASMELPQPEMLSLDTQRKYLLSQLAPYENDYVSAVRCRLALYLNCDELHDAAYDLFTYRTGERDCDLTALCARIRKLRDNIREIYAEQKRLWSVWRTNLADPDVESQYAALDNECRKLLEAAESAERKAMGRLDIRFFDPDQHGAGRLRAVVHYADGTSAEVANSVFKSCKDTNAYFTFTFVMDGSREPVAVTFAGSAYGGMGIAFTDAVADGIRYIPSAVSAVRGQVVTPHNILVDDTRSAWLGEQEVLFPFGYPGSENIEACVTVSLRKA